MLVYQYPNPLICNGRVSLAQRVSYGERYFPSA